MIVRRYQAIADGAAVLAETGETFGVATAARRAAEASPATAAIGAAGGRVSLGLTRPRVGQGFNFVVQTTGSG